MSMKIKERVFGIGLNKTGTSTLQHCFVALGLVPVASPSAKEYSARELTNQIILDGNYEQAVSIAANYQSFEDRPWNVRDMYKRLDESFPDSKFILTVRDPNSWWKSVERWITISKPHMKEMYLKHLDSPSLDKLDMVRCYQSYNDRVIEYFSGSDKLLVLDIEQGDGWEELCAFLNKSIPNIAFPHANKQAYSQLDLLEKKAKNFKKKGLICMNCGSLLKSKKRALKGASNEDSQKFILKHIVTGTARDWKNKIDIFRRGSVNARIKKIRAKYPDLTIDDLAIVTCFFNPARYTSRIRNFHTFYEAILKSGVKLLTVELAFDEQEFQLGDNIGEVIRLRSSNIMWQKERLLNIGIQELLKKGYKKIVWLDSDIVFEDVEAWPWYVAEQLEKTSICQVFSHAKIAMDSSSQKQIAWSAMRYYGASKSVLKQSIRKPSRKMPIGRPQGLSGFGWAARSEVLEKVLLYDAAILGGGDKMIYAASFKNILKNGFINKLTRSYYKCDQCGQYNKSKPYQEHYLRWAQTWCDAVGGPPGLVYQGLSDCYHGEREKRGYMKRREILYAHQFDPENDLILDENGCWKWASDKAQLYEEIARYFIDRKEDQ